MPVPARDAKVLTFLARAAFSVFFRFSAPVDAIRPGAPQLPHASPVPRDQRDPN
jgi:hypothetical protein